MGQGHKTFFFFWGGGGGEHFLDYGFYKVFVYKLKLCKGCARELNWVSGDWSVWVKAASDLFNLMYKEFIKRIRRRLRGNI